MKISILAVIMMGCCLILSIKCGTIEIQSTQPHNKNCYTQGLFFLNRTNIFQTCGLYNRSYFHIMEYQGRPFELRQTYSSPVPWKNDIFLQGAILFKGFIYVLTWRQYVVYKLDPNNNFSVVKQLRWSRQGWGLTTNGTHMFSTDGSDQIFLVDQNFTVIAQKSITTASGRQQASINQLQYVNGFIYANIYRDSKIVKIDFQNGKVVNEYEGISLVKAEDNLASGEVINGIAYDQQLNKFILTGKHWSKIHQVKFSDSSLEQEAVCGSIRAIAIIVIAVGVVNLRL